MTVTVEDTIRLLRANPHGWPGDGEAPARAGNPGGGYQDYLARRRSERLRQDQARRDLQQWAAAYRQRDQVVRMARAAGLADAEIHKLTGLARTTLARIT